MFNNWIIKSRSKYFKFQFIYFLSWGIYFKHIRTFRSKYTSIVNITKVFKTSKDSKNDIKIRTTKKARSNCGGKRRRKNRRRSKN